MNEEDPNEVIYELVRILDCSESVTERVDRLRSLLLLHIDQMDRLLAATLEYTEAKARHQAAKEFVAREYSFKQHVIVQLYEKH